MMAEQDSYQDHMDAITRRANEALNTASKYQNSVNEKEKLERLRDEFAMAALAGILSQAGACSTDYATLNAEVALANANAIINLLELNKRISKGTGD